MCDLSPLSPQILLTRLEGSHVSETCRIPLTADPVTASHFGADWEFHISQGNPNCSLKAAVRAGKAENVAAGVCWTDPEWTTDNYVLIPGAVYNGNRFHAQPYDYSPPTVGPDVKGDDRTPWIGDLPRLSLEPGHSHLDQMSIDAATPGMGIYFPNRRKALLLLTPQKNDHGPFGFEVIENDARTQAEIRLMSPGLRHDRYFSIQRGFSIPSPDRAADLKAGEALELTFRLHWVDCTSVQDLFDLVFTHRTDCFDLPPLKNEIPFSATWDLLHEKHNRENWRENLKIYQVSINHDPPNPFMLFQSGWVGGMITPYAMIQEGDRSSVDRALANIDMFLSGAMGKAGFFHEYYFDGTWCSQLRNIYDEKGNSQIENPKRPWTLVRRIGDVLYFLVRSFSLLEERGMGERIDPAWRKSLHRNAEAMVTAWRQHGEFGQYLNVDTGEVEVAGSTAAALIPAALILAGRWLKEPSWIPVAAEIGEHFRSQDLALGVTTGGPGDCVQAPDSESVAALIESFILLYEETGEQHWLQAARDATVQTASWALSYDYAFPEGSALNQIGAQSRGAFLANAQNKTGVPGICTLSGQGILRVFRATGDLRFLHFLKEIAHTIPQYMGRADKAIPTRLAWGRPGVEILPEGWICERVNVTQWGEELGEISAYSCWCEVAMMLTWCDLPGIYAQPDTRVICALDHVEAEWTEENQLRIHNPTAFPARLRCMIESSKQAKETLDIHFATGLPLLDLAPGETKVIES